MGARRSFDGEAFDYFFCWPSTQSWGGGERWYRLTLPPGVPATIMMTPSEVDLDLATIRSDTCPVDLLPPPRRPRRSRPHCEMMKKPSGEGERVEIPASAEAQTWWLVVDGPEDQEGAFELGVTCGT